MEPNETVEAKEAPEVNKARDLPVFDFGFEDADEVIVPQCDLENPEYCESCQ